MDGLAVANEPEFDSSQLFPVHFLSIMLKL